MKCLKPILVKVPFKRGAVIERYGYVNVPCGRCVNCIQTKRAELTGRLLCELETCTFGLFITLTYDDEHLFYNENNVKSVCKRDVQLFLKRFRKVLSREDIIFRYFCCSEYGESYGRPHYHLLGYFYYPPGVVNKNNIYRHKFHIRDLLAKCWRKCDLNRVDVGELEVASAHYCSKYMYKDNRNVPKGANANFYLYSKCPGLGFYYLSDKMKRSYCRIRDSDGNYGSLVLNGTKYPLSRYFKTKIFEGYSFTLDDYFKMTENQLNAAERDFIVKFNNYIKTTGDNDIDRFIKQYTKDISGELMENLHYKQKIKHDIIK